MADQFHTGAPGVDYPTDPNSAAYKKISGDPNYRFATQHPAVPLYNHAGNDGILYNHYLIASYLENLRTDVSSGLSTSQPFLDRVLAYMERPEVRLFPQGNRYAWYVNSHSKLCDAFCQAQMGAIYVNLALASPTDSRASDWRKSAVLSFATLDWAWSNRGAGHKFDDDRYWFIGAHPSIDETTPRFALNIHCNALDLMYKVRNSGHPELDVAVRARIRRGVKALFDPTLFVYFEQFYIPSHNARKHWSYHRLYQQGGGSPAQPNYQRLNYSTFGRALRAARTFKAECDIIDAELQFADSIVELWKWSHENP